MVWIEASFSLSRIGRIHSWYNKSRVFLTVPSLLFRSLKRTRTWRKGQRKGQERNAHSRSLSLSYGLTESSLLPSIHGEDKVRNRNGNVGEA